VTIVAQRIFDIPASLMLLCLSRRREFRAGLGGAQLVGPRPIVAALERLKRNSNSTPLPREMSAFGISGPRASPGSA
jgi:heat shock protein HtpX